MVLPLIVGVDGTESALRAVDWATDEAARRDLPLRIVHASAGHWGEGATGRHASEVPAEQTLAEGILRRAADRAARRDPEVRTSTVLLHRDPRSALLREACGATALVTGVGAHGLVTHMLLGSVSLFVAAHAHCPVIVVRGGAENRGGRKGRIVLGVGGVITRPETTRFAFEEAEARNCELQAVRVWRRPAHRLIEHPLLSGGPGRYLEEEAATLLDDVLRRPEHDHPDLRVRHVPAEGTTPHVLLGQTASADLLVIGANRHHGRLGPQFGRVGQAVLHHADCPVAVVPTPA